MEYTKLGRSGLRVSRLCLGTMNFGEFAPEADSFKIMDRALELGINFFDTANIYGGRAGSGLTETIIGRWFAQGEGRREQVVLATKVFGGMGNKLDGPNDVGGLSAYKIRRSLEASLSRLQTEHIELYQMHHVDRSVSWEELWAVFESVVQAGKVDYIGSSNFAGWHLGLAQAKAAERHIIGLVSEQHKYSLVCRDPELEVLPSAAHYGLGVIPWSPLGGGVLAGANRKIDSGSRMSRPEVKKRSEQFEKQVEEFQALCDGMGESPASVALAWLLANPTVTAPIIGPRTIEQLEQSMRALEIQIADEDRARIEEIFPGPGKPAPEAYAW